MHEFSAARKMKGSPALINSFVFFVIWINILEIKREEEG
jgi:hypothetical protein